MAGKKMMSPKTTIWAVDADGFDPAKPSAAKLTDEVNISCAIATGYKLNPTDSKTDPSTTICDNNNSTTLTSYNYEGEITIFRDEDLAAVAGAFAKAWAMFKHKTDKHIYLVRRVGKLSTEAAAVGDEVDCFEFIADNPVDVVADDAPIQATITFLKQGRMELNSTVVA